MTTPQAAMTPQPAMTMQQKVMLFLIPVFLGLYVLPILIAAVVAPFGGLKGTAAVGEWFFYVLTNPNDPMALMQRLLLPLAAGVTIVGFWSKQGLAFTLGLLSLTVISIVAVVLLWWFFAVPNNAMDLWQEVEQSPHKPIDSPEKFDPVARTYLLGRFEALTAYLAILLGLSAKAEKS